MFSHKLAMLFDKWPSYSVVCLYSVRCMRVLVWVRTWWRSCVPRSRTPASRPHPYSLNSLSSAATFVSSTAMQLSAVVGSYIPIQLKTLYSSDLCHHYRFAGVDLGRFIYTNTSRIFSQQWLIHQHYNCVFSEIQKTFSECELLRFCCWCWRQHSL